MKRKILGLLTILSITLALAGCGETNSTGLTNEISAIEKDESLAKTTEEVVEINENASVEDTDGSLKIVTDSGDTLDLEKDNGVKNEDGSTTYTVDEETKVTVKEDGSAVVTKEEVKIVPVEEDDEETPSPTEEPVEVHKHSYNVEVTKKATCTQSGSKTFTCSCGDTYTETIEKVAHTETDYLVEVEPTCLREGSKVKKCSVCNMAIQTQVINKLPHTPGEWEVISEVSCVNNGVKIAKCTVCGMEADKEVTTAPGHKEEWIVTEEANCLKEGKKVRVCTVCNTTFEEKVITKTGHLEGDWEVVTAANCLTEGLQVKKCTVCNTELDKGIIARTDHNASDWKTLTKANCLTEGVKVKKCTVCDVEMERDTIAKTGHTESDWSIVSNPTCVANGSRHKVCTVCNVETAVETIPTNGTHSYAWETNGDTRTMKCNGCGSTGITEYCYNGAWGYYDDGAANTLWGYVNTTRNNTQYTIMEQGVGVGVANVASLNSNGDLTNKAKSRAIEAALNFSHGSNIHECLAWGQGSPEAAMDAWLMSSGHTSAITDPAYMIGGIACFYYDSDGSGVNLTPIWVLELGY